MARKWVNHKNELRKQILQMRDQLPSEARQVWSKMIVDKVISCEQYKGADKVLLFASYRSEVVTDAIMTDALLHGKKVYFPKIEFNEKTNYEEMEFYRVFSEEDLAEGYKGIREPRANVAYRFDMSSDELEVQNANAAREEEHVLMILPGAVFDLDGNRIGYGGGFYDRYLQRYEVKICKMAVAFECQLVETGKIPKDDHDKKVDYIITEDMIHKVS